MKNPIRDKKRSYRVYRGGDWRYNMPTSYRNSTLPTRINYNIGFRLVRNKQ